MSELSKLWKRRNELSKKIDAGVCKITLVDQLLLPYYKKRVQQIDRTINTFDKTKDEYDWNIFRM